MHCSVDEEEDQQGIAHFLEHMLFLGTEKYPDPEAMRKVLGNLGMSQLADANACRQSLSRETHCFCMFSQFIWLSVYVHV